jgi:hypothetical protein
MMTHLGPGLRPHDNLWQAFAVGENGEHVDLGSYGFMTDAVAAINYHQAYHGRELINVPTPMPGSPPRYRGVRPCDGGFEVWISLRNGLSERLDGVWGFAVDAAVWRNIWIAHHQDEYANRYGTIPADEMHHD